MKQFLKFIYQIIPFKKSVFSMIKRFFKLSPDTYKHLHFKGVFKTEINKNRHFLMNHYGYYLENEVFWGGLYGNAWEPYSLKYWTELCGKADYIIDVGANTGIYSLIAKEISPNATVVAFEPVKRMYAKLKKNIELNKYDILCVEKALSNFNGETIIFDNVNSEHSYSITLTKNKSPNSLQVEDSKISVIKLDTFIQENNLSKIDLMKIDVERHEPEVLEGFKDYLILFQPTMLIEILDDGIAVRVQELLQGIPYLYFNINEKSGASKVDSLTKSDNYNFLICKKEVALELGLTV